MRQTPHSTGSPECPRNELPEIGDPFRADDHLPNSHRSDRYHYDGGQQGDREQDSIFFEIGKRDQDNHQAGTTLLKGIGMNTKVALRTTTTAPTRRLVALSGVRQRG
jgi:hypothetical protein